jgi:hypothetical protein
MLHRRHDLPHQPSRSTRPLIEHRHIPPGLATPFATSSAFPVLAVTSLCFSQATKTIIPRNISAHHLIIHHSRPILSHLQSYTPFHDCPSEKRARIKISCAHHVRFGLVTHRVVEWAVASITTRSALHNTELDKDEPRLSCSIWSRSSTVTSVTLFPQP